MLPFRLIAIVSTEPACNFVLDFVGDFPDIGFGLMLRDPEHRAESLRDISRHALSVSRPDNLTLISNSLEVPGIPFVHLTSAQLRTLHEPMRGVEVGCSAHTLDEALLAQRMGASYITFSPIFPTPSKPANPGLGVALLCEVCRQTDIPVFALGGIDSWNAGDCLAAGAFGLAAISLFTPDRSKNLVDVIWQVVGSDAPGRKFTENES